MELDDDDGYVFNGNLHEAEGGGVGVLKPRSEERKLGVHRGLREGKAVVVVGGAF